MPDLLAGLLTSGALNPIYAYTAISALIVLVWQPIKRRKLALNALHAPALWLLLFWGTTYTVLGTQELSGLLWYIAVPVLAFMSGWVIFETADEDKDKAFRRLVLAMLLGYLIHVLLNYIANIDVAYRWQMRDFFSGEVRAATGSACLNTYAVSLLGYWLLIQEKKRYKLLGLVLTVPFLLYVLQLGSRTQLVILVLVFLPVLCVSQWEKYGLTALAHILIVLLVLGAAGAAVWQLDLFGVRELIGESNLLERLLQMETERELQRADQYRFDSVRSGLESLLEHPLGGQIERRYFHNMWLDVGRVAGVVPFAAMVLFTLTVLGQSFSIFRAKLFDIKTRYMMMCLQAGILLNFMVEPVIEGLFDFFLAYCLLSGITAAMYHYGPAGPCGIRIGIGLPKIRIKWS